jgi:acyl-coenzyme A synthetase/AMP-(fatty) acid ligase
MPKLGPTGQRIAHFARRRPEAVAVIHQNRPICYSRLARLILHVMHELTSAGIRSGQVLGVEAGDRCLHLLILLAAEALEVTTMTLTAAECASPARLDLLCDRIIASQPIPVMDAAKVLRMPHDWLETILAAVKAHPAENAPLDWLEREASPDAVVRIIKSSGTTGIPKAMGMTYRVQQSIIRKTMLHAPPWLQSHPVFLCLYNFGVRSSHVRALFTLQRGGTIHLTGSDVIWDLVVAGTGNFVLFVAGDLERFVRTAPDGRGPFRLYIYVVGAEVPRMLREQTRTRVSEDLVVTYSSNEVNVVSFVDDDNVGRLVPGVSVRILDENGHRAKPGEEGLIHVRSDTMTDGYLNAPDATGTAFVNGWFRTSDRGFQPAAGRLVVLGRDDDMLNIGGVKVAPGPIEQRLRMIDGIRDAFVTTVDDHVSTRIMLVAAETEAHSDTVELTRHITPVVRAQVTYFQLIFLPAFPRTETGKVRREAIRDLYRRRAQSL